MHSELALYMGRQVKGLSGTTHADLSTWRYPDMGALSPERLDTFLKRKRAVEMYLDGLPEDVIFEKCGIRLKQIYRLISERCLVTHPDQHIYGWRGLIPGLHIQTYRRTLKPRVDFNGKGGAGSLTLILQINSKLKEKLDERILASPSKNQLGLINTPRKSHWLWFLSELSKLGYEARDEWPFNTKTRGYSSICRYIDQVFAGNPHKAIRTVSGPDGERKIKSGDGVDRPIHHIYERVEMDAQKIDGIFCIMVPDAAGGLVPRVIHRLWVIVLIEITSRAALGYHLSLNKEVNKNDVLRAIKNALSVWKPLPIAFENAYVKDAGFPSSLTDKFIGVCWKETSVDGALAETCDEVKKVLETVVGSTLRTPNHGFSSRRSKDDRPFIETFFRVLGKRGFQRLSNSTGGKAGDTVGRDPAKIAAQSQFQWQYAEELLDVLIANYNATKHSALGYRSPLEYLQYMASRPDLRLEYADPNAVQALLSLRRKCRVKGGMESGRKPYVNFIGARYSNEILGQRYDLVGNEIWVINHLEDDARVAQASLLNGMSLGILRAAPPWHRLPHSLKIRQAILSCERKGLIDFTDGRDAVEIFMEFWGTQKSKKLQVHPAYLEEQRILGRFKEVEPIEVQAEIAAPQTNSKPIAATARKTNTVNIAPRPMVIIKPHHD